MVTDKERKRQAKRINDAYPAIQRETKALIFSIFLLFLSENLSTYFIIYTSSMAKILTTDILIETPTPFGNTFCTLLPICT